MGLLSNQQLAPSVLACSYVYWGEACLSLGHDAWVWGVIEQKEHLSPAPARTPMMCRRLDVFDL
jgi:hypothetical protein